MTRLTETIALLPGHRVTDGAGVAGTMSPVVSFVVMPVLACATILVTLLGNGNPILSMLPVLGALVVWAIWVAPLRTTLGIAMVMALSVDRPGDAMGLYESPLSLVGGLAFQNLNKVVPIDALKFSGVFALLAFLLVVRGYRVLTGRERDTPGSLTMAAPLRWAIGLSLAAVAAFMLWGLALGGDLQMAKVQTQGYAQLLVAAYLFGVSFRGVRDYRTVGILVVVAACLKAILALWIRTQVPEGRFVTADGTVYDEVEFVTNHGDSILFASAMAVLVGPFFQQPTRRHVYAGLLLIPLIAAGIFANDRRIAWVQVGLIVFACLAWHPASWITRRLARVIVLTSPLLLVYVVVGWSSPSRVFGPVQFVRGIVQAERTDGSLDRSTLFRDMENYNLAYTFRSSPVVGTGFGHPFRQAVETDSLEDFREYPFLPHNALLGLWAFTGFLGFTSLFATVVVALFLAARGHASATTPDERVAVTAAVGVVAAYLVHVWADIGLTEAATIFPVGIALAIIGQTAMATGAWPARWRQWRPV